MGLAKGGKGSDSDDSINEKVVKKRIMLQCRSN